jgi:hypothetical protein
MPFDTINGQGRLAQGANILSSTRQVDIIKHPLEALQGEMGVMQMQLWEVTSKHVTLCEELATYPKKCLGVEQNVAIQ